MTPNKTGMIYEIRVWGRLDKDWVEWFNDMTLTHTSEGQTILTGPAIDQAALYGLLIKMRDLGLSLISVNPLETDTTREK
ncbi:MAG: hypothetical protein GY805_13195 [Chloroflexi bacterium]|nr:hypothetical protein [Chloroflexota bacterium]